VVVEKLLESAEALLSVESIRIFFTLSLVKSFKEISQEILLKMRSEAVQTF